MRELGKTIEIEQTLTPAQEAMEVEQTHTVAPAEGMRP
jgi:hypothetical protein